MTSQFNYQRENKLILPTFHTIEIVSLSQIVYINAYESFVKVHLDNGTNFICTLSFRQITVLLDESIFFQSHKSYIVNLKHLIRYIKTGELELSVGLRIPLARRRKEEFIFILHEYYNTESLASAS